MEFLLLARNFDTKGTHRPDAPTGKGTKGKSFSSLLSVLPGTFREPTLRGLRLRPPGAKGPLWVGRTGVVSFVLDLLEARLPGSR